MCCHWLTYKLVAWVGKSWRSSIHKVLCHVDWLLKKKSEFRRVALTLAAKCLVIFSCCSDSSLSYLNCLIGSLLIAKSPKSIPNVYSNWINETCRYLCWMQSQSLACCLFFFRLIEPVARNLLFLLVLAMLLWLSCCCFCLYCCLGNNTCE